MTKTPTPQNGLDAIATLCDELRLERAESRRQVAEIMQATDARIKAIEADLQAARAAAAGVNPMQAGDANATKQLLSHFDAGLRMEEVVRKTDAFFKALDTRTCAVWAEALTGDQLFACMAECGPEHNAHNAILSLAGTARLIGVSSPDQSETVRKEIAIAKWMALCGVRARPSWMYVAAVPEAEANEIRAKFAEVFEKGVDNNSLIDMARGFVKRMLEREIIANREAHPKQEDAIFPDRYRHGESPTSGAIQPLFAAGIS